MSQPFCLIKQAHCGRIDGNPVCPKCGIDEGGWYTTEEARLLAIANATATYWQAHAKSLEDEKTPPQPPKPAEQPIPPEQPKPAPPKPPEQPALPVKSKFGMGLLAAAVIVLGSGFGIWRYQEDKVAEAFRDGVRLSLEQEKNKVVAAPAATDAAPSSNRCTDCPEMVVVPGGNFQMGSNDSDSRDNEKVVHSVSVKSFAIGRYEVTQGQWRVVMGNNPSHFANCGDNCPIEQVSWNDIQSYIQKLNQKTGQQFRLPSEAEWEYACRGGQQHKYCGSNDVGSVAWYGANSASTTHRVGQKAPNAFGLYDMSGNVWEWVEDWYHDSYNGAPSDGSAWVTGGEQKYRVLRGGSWGSLAWFTRAAYRDDYSPGDRYSYYGFRLARTAP